jgi:hypothetical protein
LRAGSYDHNRVNSTGPSSAEKTAAIVSSAVETGASLCIPGAREPRVGRPAGRDAVAAGATPSEAAAGTASQREQREYQRAGGGAASERGLTRHTSVIERLCRLLRVSPGRHDAVTTPDSTTLSSLPR